MKDFQSYHLLPFTSTAIFLLISCLFLFDFDSGSQLITVEYIIPTKNKAIYFYVSRYRDKAQNYKQQTYQNFEKSLFGVNLTSLFNQLLGQSSVPITSHHPIHPHIDVHALGIIQVGRK